MVAPGASSPPSAPALGPFVSCAFDAGNIVVKSIVKDGNTAARIRLSIRPDPYTAGTDEMSHAQWFYFKVSGCQGVECTISIEDMEIDLPSHEAVCSYPEGFVGYDTVASYDRREWFRVRGTHYAKGSERLVRKDADDFNETGDEDEDLAKKKGFLALARKNSDAHNCNNTTARHFFLPLARHNSDARSGTITPLAPIVEGLTTLAVAHPPPPSVQGPADTTKNPGSGGVLSWSVTPAQDAMYFAYWTPYSWERHADLVAELAQSPRCAPQVLGQTLDGRDLDVLVFGTGPLQLWVAARQHPGESMAEWCAEGVIRKLDDPYDPKARRLRQVATIHVVPNMNPDGSVRGHLRTNAGGANLNREWAGAVYDDYDAPTLERSPEVFHVLTYLDAHGCDGYVDIHGDEEIEANFIAGAEGTPIHDAGMKALYEEFAAHFCEASPDFQHAPGVPGRGYELSEPGESNLSEPPGREGPQVCTNAVAERYGCLAVTLEQPFKDTTFHTPDPDFGWSGPRAVRLGAALVDALLDTVPAIVKRKDALGLGRSLVKNPIGKALH